MSARRFAHKRMDTVALMKSLGASQQFVVVAASVQLFIIGVLGIAVGSVVGFLMEKIVTAMLADIIQGDLPAVGFSPVLLASASAIVLLIGFALPSLIQLRDTPPLRVLRHDEMPPPPSRLLIVSTALVAVTAAVNSGVTGATARVAFGMIEQETNPIMKLGLKLLGPKMFRDYPYDVLMLSYLNNDAWPQQRADTDTLAAYSTPWRPVAALAERLWKEHRMLNQATGYW